MRRLATIGVLIVAVGFAVPAFAQSGTSDTADRGSEASNKASSDSEFEKTRQHMIEKNRESQRTGKM